MSTPTNDVRRHGPRSPLTLDEGITIWRARDVYRVRRGLYSVVLLFLLLEALGFAARGRWDLVLTVVGFQAVTLWGLAWLLRRAGAWVRTWWHGLVLVALLGLTLSGCESLERGVAKLHGMTVDPLPGPCAPESFQARRCIAVQQEGGKR